MLPKKLQGYTWTRFKKIRVEFPDVPIKLVWDGVSCHRSQIVKEAAKVLDIHLEPLLAYRPDFMPVEHLWQWLREDVTYHTCYERKAELIDNVKWFESLINTLPLAIADRLWVKTHLDSEEEKLRFSA
jgi:transposase